MRPAYISAYAASPAYARWDPALEAELLPALCALPGVVGLEVPWLGALHPHDPDWFVRHVPQGARLAVTPLPWIMRRTAERPGYGIASRDAGGRSAALDDLQHVCRDIRRLGGAVELVAVHTAPRGGGDPAAMAASLDELRSWDWGGARLVVEHCDAVRPGRPFEKGFLALADELAVLDGTDVGLWLNWGRSAIELRDPDAVTDQIRDAAASGRLAGLTFSGAAAEDGPYGGAWIDTHPPLLSADPASKSLLDDAHVAGALAAAPDAPALGLKVSRLPSDRTAADVVATVARNLDVIRRLSR